MDRTGQIIADRYRILSLVGEGGMGAVYLAEHTHMRKRFALKLLHAQMAKNDEVLARFRREAEAAAKVEHPNIVAATDFGQTEDGAFYLVLEYVDGITLRKKLAEAPFEAPRALHITRQIALALERAHDAGIVHRDIKPENVMLVTKGTDPDFVKVLDFGVARIDRPSGGGGGEPGQLLTQAGTVMGSPTYMAPEQCVGDRVTLRADLYSLGCVLYEMLTNEVPFDGDMMELLTKHVLEPVPLMRDKAPKVIVPAPIEAVVRKLLEKEADNRYPSARAVVEAIDQAVLDSGLDVPWGSPRSERGLTASAPMKVVVPASAADERAPTEKPPRNAAARAGFLERVEPHVRRGAEALKPLIERVDAELERLAARVKLPKIALLAGVGAIAFLSLVLVVVIATRDPHKKTESTVAKLLAGRETATQEEIRAAATKGAPALEELSLRFPNDASVARELVFAYDAAGRSADALRVMRHMVEADPKSVPKDLVRVVIRAASKVETSDEAFRLLEGPLGADGVDALMELAEGGEGVTPSTKSRAQKSLSKPSVRANAPPAVVFLVDLTNASTCDERRAVLVKSGKQADARALTALRALEVKHGCGKKKRYDCNPCLRKDDALADAIQAAQSSASR